MTDAKKQSPENGLRRALDVEIVQNLLEVAELRGEMRASLQAINGKIDRLLALQEKVERNSQAITRLKTIWSFVAAGIALVVAALREWLLERTRQTGAVRCQTNRYTHSTEYDQCAGGSRTSTAA